MCDADLGCCVLIAVTEVTPVTSAVAGQPSGDQAESVEDNLLRKPDVGFLIQPSRERCRPVI